VRTWQPIINPAHTIIEFVVFCACANVAKSLQHWSWRTSPVWGSMFVEQRDKQYKTAEARRANSITTKNIRNELWTIKKTVHA
jgi:hypothetical protein